MASAGDPPKAWSAKAYRFLLPVTVTGAKDAAEAKSAVEMALGDLGASIDLGLNGWPEGVDLQWPPVGDPEVPA